MQSAGDNMLTLYASTPLPVFYPLKNKHEIDAQAEKVKYSEQILRDTELTLESAWKSEVLKTESLRRSVENYTKYVKAMTCRRRWARLRNENCRFARGN
jgi:hypothetical protein